MPKFIIMPRRWRGIRNSEPSLLLEPDEWADSKNFDARFGITNEGSVQVITAGPASKAVVGLSSFYRPDGSLHRVWINQDGTVFEDTTTLSVTFSGALGLSNPDGLIPTFARGTGAIVIPRITQDPIWRDPADGVWKVMTTAPDFLAGATFERGGPRLFGFTFNTDSMYWTVAGSLSDWTGTGSGSEPIGNDRGPIRAIAGELEDNMVIYKDHSIYGRFGSDPNTWDIRLISSDIGCVAPQSIVRIGKSHAFVHESGVYLLNAVGAITFPPLTWRIQQTWDNMIASFGSFLKYAVSAYNSREQTLYVWVPNSSSRIMNRLLKIYLPDQTVTIHDGKSTGGAHYFPAVSGGIIEYGANSKILKTGGTTDDGTAISATMTSGIFCGNPPSMDTEKRWGKRGILHFFFETRVDFGQSVTITPRVYRGNASLSGTAQVFFPPDVQLWKAKVKMPDDAGWGFDFLLDTTLTSSRLKFIGIAGEYEDQTDE